MSRLAEAVTADAARAPGYAEFVATLRQLASATAHDLGPATEAAGLFKWDEGSTIHVARAPGRLDVMGGIADYSGSLVLQLPINEACFTAVQLCRPTAGTPPQLRIVSLSKDPQHRAPAYSCLLQHLYPAGQALPYAAARAYFKAQSDRSWAAYVAGCLLVLSHAKGILFGSQDVAILVSSTVPEGKGVSSSAAVEVATMQALLSALGVAHQVQGRELAILCQQVENLVVGAPCGIMDQMASALGQSGQLLALLCQPAEVQGCVALPSHLAVWGIDSGIRHNVGSSDYGRVRVGAFMGLRILSKPAQGATHQLDSADVAMQCTAPSPLRGGYIANLTPSEYASSAAGMLPETLSGAEFLAQYVTHYDTVTTVEPGQQYAVRQPTVHPIHEHSRVHMFRQLLLAPPSTEQAALLGELMYQSHQSYSACGLGSPGTDRLVAMVREHQLIARAAGQQPVLHGAKITGGGSGGTVCVLGDASPAAHAAVHAIAAAYAAETCQPYVTVFAGSSMGASEFGHMVLTVQC